MRKVTPQGDPKNRIDFKTLILNSDSKFNLHHDFMPEEKAQILSELQKIALNPYLEFNEILAYLKNSPILNFISPLGQALKSQSVLFLQNLPVDTQLVDTPLDEQTPSAKQNISELILLLLSAAFNLQPYINLHEKNNNIIQNVIPIAGKETEESSAGSHQDFDWHTESIHAEQPANYFMLMALRGDKNAWTCFLTVEELVANLPQSLINKLLTTPFLMKTGPSYQQEMSILRPILSKDENQQFNIYYNSNPTRCIALDREGEMAYQKLQAALKKLPTYAINLYPGEVLILNNQKALHRRDGFKISTTYEKRRWLQRVYLRTNFEL